MRLLDNFETSIKQVPVQGAGNDLLQPLLVD